MTRRARVHRPIVNLLVVHLPVELNSSAPEGRIASESRYSLARSRSAELNSLDVARARLVPSPAESGRVGTVGGVGDELGHAGLHLGGQAGLSGARVRGGAEDEVDLVLVADGVGSVEGRGAVVDAGVHRVGGADLEDSDVGGSSCGGPAAGEGPVLAPNGEKKSEVSEKFKEGKKPLPEITYLQVWSVPTLSKA